MILAAIILIPLIASVLQLFIAKRFPAWTWITVGAIGVSWILSMALFVPAFFLGRPIADQTLTMTWAETATSLWRLGIRADGLTLSMLFVVSTCSLLIHIFSTGYMHGNPLYTRFFAYISFFTFAMLGLVGSDNFVFLFICWELMGLCSYLLIGFYSWCPECGYDRITPYKAAIKAFLTTRVGDVGLFIGIGIFYHGTGSLTFHGIQTAIHNGVMSHSAMLVGALFILSGAIGKSAQFPLHVWLPDAMEGPSPVSALIHAATMVAAGIYLVGRSIMFDLFPPGALFVTAMVGSFTAFFAATMALPAYDFKKILAYSTISQLGFMLASLGVGGWTPGFFHLTTHAFFKALLFLGSGAVLHAVHTRDMREMGGLKAMLPITYWTMLIGSLSLSGFPLLAGFFSKDEILASALVWGMSHHDKLHYVPFVFLICAAAMTAFYTFRMMFLVFHGEPAHKAHGHHDAHHDAHAQDHGDHGHHNHEPFSMMMPLVVLAILAIFAGYGWLATPFHDLVKLEPRETRVAAADHAAAAPQEKPEVEHAPAEPAAGESAHGDDHEAMHHKAHNIAMAASIVAGLGGIGLAMILYLFRILSPELFLIGPGRWIHAVLVNLYWIDALYLSLVEVIRDWVTKILYAFDDLVIDGMVNATAPALIAATRTADFFDMQGVDGVVNAVADITADSGNNLRRLQTGKIQDYALGAMAAILFFVLWAAM